MKRPEDYRPENYLCGKKPTKGDRPLSYSP